MCPRFFVLSDPSSLIALWWTSCRANVRDELTHGTEELVFVTDWQFFESA